MADLPPGVFRVCGKYRLRKKIGSGSFGEFLHNLYLQHSVYKPTTLYIGEVYYAVNVLTGEGIAVKMESLDVDNPKLSYEWKVYKSLGGGLGIP